MVQLFVSYPREYRSIVDRLVSDLRKSGYDPYIDQELAGGQDWWNELMSRIEGADAFVPMIGRKYLDSKPCELEASHAAALLKPILPIVVEDVPAPLFPEIIASAHWATYDPEEPNSVLGVIRAINSIGPPPEPPDPKPARPIVPISYLTKLRNEIGDDAEINRSRQLVIISDLKVQLSTADRAAAVHLLEKMRQRPDIGYQAALDIDEALERARRDQVRLEQEGLDAQRAEQARLDAEKAATQEQEQEALRAEQPQLESEEERKPPRGFEPRPIAPKPAIASTTGRIFLCCDSDDTPWLSAALYDRLTELFGAERVLRDAGLISPGEDTASCTRVISEVESCTIMLVVIGKNWLNTRGPGLRDLLDPTDFVQVEIHAAIDGDLLIVPLLVDGATMPQVDELPHHLAALAQYQAIELDSKRWFEDTEYLLTALQTVLVDPALGIDEDLVNRQELFQESPHEGGRVSPDAQFALGAFAEEVPDRSDRWEHQDIDAVRFTPVRLREGYDMREVDQFLDTLAADLKAREEAIRAGHSDIQPLEFALSPQDVRNARFTPVRIREGYDMGEVDQFLDKTEQHMAELDEELERRLRKPK